MEEDEQLRDPMALCCGKMEENEPGQGLHVTCRKSEHPDSERGEVTDAKTRNARTKNFVIEPPFKLSNVARALESACTPITAAFAIINTAMPNWKYILSSRLSKPWLRERMFKDD